MQDIQYYPGAIDATDCIKNGWNLVGQNYWLYFGITIVCVLMISCIPCVNLFIYGPMMCGIYLVYLMGIRGEMVDFGMLFKGFDKFLPAMGIGLIEMIPGILMQVVRITVDVANIGIQGGGHGNENFYQIDNSSFAIESGLLFFAIVAFLVLFILAIVIRITLAFALPLLIEHDLTAMEAIKLSARAGWSNIGGLILLAILTGLIVLLGALACVVGMFFVMPIIYAANTFAYRQVFPDTKSSFQNMPPPPTSYEGGAYGTAQ